MNFINQTSKNQNANKNKTMIRWILIAIFLSVPFVTMFSLNQLFRLNIEYSLVNFLAFSWLIFLYFAVSIFTHLVISNIKGVK